MIGLTGVFLVDDTGVCGVCSGERKVGEFSVSEKAAEGRFGGCEAR